LDEVDCENVKADKEVLLVRVVICACAKCDQFLGGGCVGRGSEQFVPHVIMK